MMIGIFFTQTSDFLESGDMQVHKLGVRTIYSDGAINSKVDDFISGRLDGSPYVLVVGSY